MTSITASALGVPADREPVPPGTTDLSATPPSGLPLCAQSLPASVPPLVPPSDLDSWGVSRPVMDLPLLPDIVGGDVPGRSSGALANVALPEAGSRFLGFELLAELGRGAFGRVFLAQQTELSNRLVALKVSTESLTESQKLAQLQHTHIVPIYSFHQAGPLQAVCMPYFGSATLSDVLTDVQQRPSLPESGKGFISTLQKRRDRTARSVDSHRGLSAVPASVPQPTTSPRPEAAPAPLPAGNPATLRLLEGYSYIEAVLWVGARLADGLAHAHERGILHRDLKPANILLTEDGLPMLLDFNLAEDTKRAGQAEAALIGGTLPYMAPEHLAAFQGAGVPVDERADIYSLGLILTELLLGRHPFTRHVGPPENILPMMIAERQAGLRSLRRINRAISPATEAILRRCLEPDPARRYRSARHLQEDLERQLNHLPLRHTPEPSLSERARKWVRRNPWVTSTTTLAVALILAAGVVAGTLNAWSRRLTRFEAVAAHQTLSHDTQLARVLLAGRQQDRAEGESVARDALARFAALEPAEPTLPAGLAPGEKSDVRQQLSELLFLLAGSQSDLDRALALNDQAARSLGTDETPRAFHLQRADLLKRLGRVIEAEGERERAATRSVRSAWEQSLLAREQLRQGEISAALDQLRALVRKDPSNGAAWYLLGNCTLEAAANQLARDSDAIAAYTACLALTPDFHGLYFNRGLAHLRQRNYREAQEDFSRVLELRPGLSEVYLHRAQTWEGLGQPQRALEDVTTAIERGHVSHRALATRARLRASMGDSAGASADRAELLKREPTDEESYIVRGSARLATDVAGALADFEAAVRLNPQSLAGWHNQAHVLSEKLNQPRSAIDRLAKVLKIYPNLASALAGRGVLHARLGERDAALRDARRALELDAGAEILYQTAGVYALTSQQEPRDRPEALRLLARALQLGFGLDLIDRDPDLLPLRDDPARKEIVEAARLLRQRASGGLLRK